MQKTEGHPENPNVIVLERFLRAERPKLLAFARSNMGPQLSATTTAHDIVNETSLRAFQDIDKFQSKDDDGTGMKAWVYTILRHVIAHAARKNLGTSRKKHKGIARLESDILNAQPADAPTLSRQAATDETNAFLAAAVAALPPNARIAVELHYFQGMDVPDIATKLGKSPAAISQLLHRAREQLRELMGSSSLYVLPGRKLKPKIRKQDNGHQ